MRGNGVYLNKESDFVVAGIARPRADASIGPYIYLGMVSVGAMPRYGRAFCSTRQRSTISLAVG